MDSRTIRSKFLQFFKEKGHEIVPSAPLVIKDDPTLMFTNAGMNQFKDYFLGNKVPPKNRIADTQKCLRVSGKHNDLEEVGHDTYHHTMFEMLGNWSFGDYFKKEAIEWAWELITGVYKLPADRLYATIFTGDTDEKLSRDEEAFNYWAEILPAERILEGSKKDNFWEMGDTGPCGPCSELHIDLRPEKDRLIIEGKTLVNKDHPLVVELWNLVFIEFNRKENGTLEKLPQTHVDTGMGFERLCMAIQGKLSNYDTDVFKPIIDEIGILAGLKYGEDPEKDIAARVVADHVRAVSFAIADGQLPSNTGAGYVIRRILRRAVRYGFTFLGFRTPTIYRLTRTLADSFKGVFDELDVQIEFVSKVIEEEENAFLHTLDNGLKKLNRIIEEIKREGSDTISGEVTFELFDTFGFPVDLTELIARENGLMIDSKGFEAEMKQQKERSRSDADKDTGDWEWVRKGEATEFIGYDTLQARVKITRYRRVNQKGKKFYQLVLDQTPCYGESGGQVGDKAVLKNEEESVKIFDTRKENDLILHYVDKLPIHPDALFTVEVDQVSRKSTMNNHSSTHLLHAALKKVLGKHVEQRGSLVNDKILRFDFSHFTKMTDEEILEVEQIVNEKIRANISLQEDRNVPIEEAKKRGATALFGEKYGEFVRVITFDKQFSVELCGGTHVSSTGTIGLFKIVSEYSIAAGIRRIEAVTGEGAEKYVWGKLKTLEEISDAFKHPKDLVAAVASLVETKAKLEKENEKMKLKELSGLKDTFAQKAYAVGDMNVIVEKISLPDAETLKKLSFDLRNKVTNLALVLAAEVDGKPQISVMFDDMLVKKGFNAGEMVRELAKEINGGGGGQPFFATAGGKSLEGLDKVVQKAKFLFNEAN
ncbi:MAG: alanine--tRNA ligase [Cyclobacteriaceae bacterium]|nr:alanine--tRNA ligase [Cyclobacteriaceae bacterium]